MLATVSLIVLSFATHQSLKAYLHLIFLRALQPLNIPFIPVTLDVLKLDKSSEVKPMQPLNILPIFVTADVSKMDKLSEVNELQP